MPILTAIIKNSGTNRKTITGQKLLILLIPIGLKDKFSESSGFFVTIRAMRLHRPHSGVY